MGGVDGAGIEAGVGATQAGTAAMEEATEEVGEVAIVSLGVTITGTAGSTEGAMEEEGTEVEGVIVEGEEEVTEAGAGGTAMGQAGAGDMGGPRTAMTAMWTCVQEVAGAITATGN